MKNDWPNLTQKKIVFEALDYDPYPEQWPFHFSNKDVIQVVGAEGSGKSQIASNEMTACIFRKRTKLIYLIGETYVNPRKEFEYLRDNLLRLGAVKQDDISFPKNGKCSLVTFSGCKIETLSAQEGASAVIATGEQADIYCLTEAGIIGSYGMFTACVRRATRNQGRVILVGTLTDNFGWYASLVDELRVPNNIFRGETFSLPAWINKSLYPGGKDDPEILRLKEILTDDEFNRTIAAERSIPPALIFGNDFSYSKNVQPCLYNPSLPVTLSFDPGYSVSAYSVGAFQFPRNDNGDEEIWQIDELYLHGHTHKMVCDIVKSLKWWTNVDRVVSDIAARQHQAAESGEEVWRFETGRYVHNQSVGVMDGIDAHKSHLYHLKHDPSCKHTLNEYRLYRRPTDRDGNPTSDKPLDRDNHAMKMIAYMLVDRYGFVSKSYNRESIIMAMPDVIREENKWF